MTSKSAPFQTPDQPNRVKSRFSEASPNFNAFVGQLPDLTPPRKNGTMQYSGSYGSLNPSASSPAVAAFGAFARLPASSPEPLRGSDGKTENAYADALGLRGTPVKGSATSADFGSSPRSGLFMAAPNIPIFQPSPRRPSDASYLSPPPSRPRAPSASGADLNFSFSPTGFHSPPPAAGPAQLISTFASIMDGSSRISPSNLSVAAAAARDGPPGTVHFAGLFKGPTSGQEGGATGGPATGPGAKTVRDNEPGAMVPIEVAMRAAEGSPLQLARAGGTSSDDGGTGSSDDDGEEGGGGMGPPLRRPERRRALDFDHHPGTIPGWHMRRSSVCTTPLAKMSPSPSAFPPLGPSAALLPIRGLATGLRRPGMEREGQLSGMDALSHSPIRQGVMRREDIIDSPAVKEATNAAVAAALHAAGGGRGVLHSQQQRRPSRAAAAGAAAAAAAAAAAGTPVARRAAGSARAHAATGLRDLAALPGGDGPTGPSDVKCNCKKSRCLKLYCDCFKVLGYCHEACSCNSCLNRHDNLPAIAAARDAILARNPKAFSQKIVEDQHRKGCNCKKSKCLKKYCECFSAGIACSDSCKCDTCQNTGDGVASRRSTGGQSAAKRQRLERGSTLVRAEEEEEEEEEEEGHEPGPGRGSGVSFTPAATPAAPMRFAPLGPAAQQLLFQQAQRMMAQAAANGGSLPGVAMPQQLLRQLSEHGAAVAAAAAAAAASRSSPAPGPLSTPDGQLLVPLNWSLQGGGGALLPLPPGAPPGAPLPNLTPLVAAVAANGASPLHPGLQTAAGAAATTAATAAAAPAVADLPRAGAATPSLGTHATGSQDPSSTLQGPSQGDDSSGAGSSGAGTPCGAAALSDVRLGLDLAAQAAAHGGAAPLAMALGKAPGGPGASRASARRAAKAPASGGAGAGPLPPAVRAIPTKRKPARTMTAALM